MDVCALSSPSQSNVGPPVYDADRAINQGVNAIRDDAAEWDSQAFNYKVSLSLQS